MPLLKVLFLVTLVGIAGCENREAARRRQTIKNLKQIGLALHANYAQEAKPASNNEPTAIAEAPPSAAPKPDGQADEGTPPPPGVPE